MSVESDGEIVRRPATPFESPVALLAASSLSPPVTSPSNSRRANISSYSSRDIITVHPSSRNKWISMRLKSAHSEHEGQRAA